MQRNVLGKFALLLGVAALGVGLATTSAHALSVTPLTANWTSNDNSNCNAACVEGITGIPGLTSLYKMDVGAGADVGSLAGSYSTTFANTATDPADFTITYVSGAFASCPECILVVKDGKQIPAQYFFNLSGWDGTDSIFGTGFWPSNGAISHVEIFGSATSVPEPASLLLLGAGLAGIGIWRRKSAKS